MKTSCVRYARPYVPFYTFSKIFVPFGELESVAILKPKDSTRTQTCGFVRFASVADAARAIRDLNGKHIVDSVRTPQFSFVSCLRISGHLMWNMPQVKPNV
jgi:hypothetical protein